MDISKITITKNSYPTSLRGHKFPFGEGGDVNEKIPVLRDGAGFGGDVVGLT
jgi:hypothetical protein